MRVIILLLLLTIIPEFASAVPVIKIQDYNKSTDITDRKVVLIQKGDNPEYKEPAFNDSDWTAISLPSSWDTVFPGWSGICWYRLHVQFPPEMPEKSIGIKLGIIDDVDEVFMNGQLIGKSGEFPPERRSAYDKKRIYEIPAKLIKPDRINLIAIRVHGLFSGEMGPYKGRFEIAPLRRLLRDDLASEFIDVLFAAIYLVVGLYFSLIFITRTITREYLFFSLFTLSASIYIFLRTQIKYFLTDNFFILKLSEYFVLIVMLVFMMEYITYFYKRKHTVFHYLYFAIAVVSLLIIFITRDPYAWNKTLVYLIEPSWLLPIIVCLYISVKELKKYPDAKYLLISFIIIWIMFINDVLIERLLYRFIPLSRYGFLIVITGTAMIMRNRYIRLDAEATGYRIRKMKSSAITDETRIKFGKALAYIEENYISDIARENFAEAIGLNHDYLGKLFIRLKGMKMSEYINLLRIKKAEEMLKDNTKNVTEIAFAVGFDSLSTFYRVFQKIMNESPNSYRERLYRNNL